MFTDMTTVRISDLCLPTLEAFMLWNEFGSHNLQISHANWQIGMANLQIGQVGRLDGTCLIILFLKLLFLHTAKSAQYVTLKRELLHGDLRLYETPSED